MVQKILVATLSQNKPAAIEAVYDNSVLVLNEQITFRPSPDALKEDLVPRLIKRRSSGFKVLMDEVSGEFCKLAGCNRVRLDDKHHDGRPVLVVALERYQELRRLNAILYSGSGFDISPSIVDTTSNARGETIYNIAWAEIKVQHILVLLCVYATVMNRPATADFFAKVANALSFNEPKETVGDWLEEHQNQRESPPRSLTGTKTNDGDVIL